MGSIGRAEKSAPLAIIDTHPVQYRAPVYQALARDFGVPVTVIYGSDFSVAGYRDREFGASIAWDIDLLSETNARFLSRVKHGGADCFDSISPAGLGEALDEAKPSAILACGYRPVFHLAGILHARRRRIPVLFRAETSDISGKAAPPRNPFSRNLLRDAALRSLYSRVDRVLPIGTRSREHYLRLGVPDCRMIASPYCVNTAPFRCEERDRERLREPVRRQLNIESGDLAIVFSGKLSKRKGVHVLAAAAKSLSPELRSRTVILFLGTGSEYESLMQSCAFEPRIRAKFIGFRNQTELSPYYHAADMLALPSLWGETWGLVVNEALHHGLPAVVSAAVGCAPDLIEEGSTGAIAAPGSSDSLADAIRRAARLAGDAETRRRCRAKVSAYSTEAAARGIVEAWKQVVGSNANAPAGRNKLA